ncbi:unnamed protein product [Cuscuta epithymum]|uniref:Major facilitator superfamily (MFS) profile domain-containing protein n=1 Tax=Cuscuta epithymum TaxID=186058 RepID=A0AAV0F7X5_9ASTE|nr:unnamed protein product [Cuscuta epithymum]
MDAVMPPASREPSPEPAPSHREISSGNVTPTALDGCPLAHVKYRLWRVALGYILAFFGGIAYGYSQTFVGGLLNMPKFQVVLVRKSYVKLVKAMVSNFCTYVNGYMLICSASVPIGTSIGLIMGIKLQSFCGPKWRLRIGAMLVVMGALCAIAIPLGITLGIFFFVIGIGIGNIREVVPILYKQITPQDVHQRIDNIFDLAYYVGLVAALLVNYLVASFFQNGWKVTFIAIAIPAVMLILASIVLFLVEVNEPKVSPRVLLSQHRSVFVSRTLFLLLAQFIGSSQLVFYGPMILESLKFGSYNHQFLAPLIGCSLGSLTVTFVILYLIPHHRRRQTFFIACITICVSQIGIWLLFFFWGSQRHHFKSPFNTIAGVLLMLIYSSYFVIDGPYGWTRKRYPKAAQGVGSTLETAIMRFVVGIMNSIVPFLLCLFKKWVFMYLALVALVYSVIALYFVSDDHAKDHIVIV